MRSTRLSSDVEVEYDERLYTVSSPTSSTGSTTRGRGGFGGPPTLLATAPDSGPVGSFARILVERNVASKAAPPIAFVPAPEAATIARAAPQASPNRIHVAVDEDQQAVVLLERDGLLSWRFPDADVSSAADHRGAPGKRRLSFDIQPGEGELAGVGAQKRGWVSDQVIAGAKAVVLYFAADYAAGKIVGLLEKGSREGPVVITSESDPGRWLRPDDFSKVALPGSPRVLLFVHGTFSTTVGGFGGLTVTPWGRNLLRTAIARYDAVIGFDHRTLSVSPDVNAAAILDALKTLPGEDIVVDAICHSRGGLVLRALIEAIATAPGMQCRIARAIFVAATNNGTELARPANWAALIDLMTNLAAATAKVLSLFPASAAVATITEEVVSCIGDFVKYLVTVAVDERRVPGIAAMAPGGEFIAGLGRPQGIRATLEALECYAVVSNFRTTIADQGRHEPKEFPRRLAMLLADGVVDRLMRGDGVDAVANDLVVNVASMTDIDRAVPVIVRDVMDFGTNDAVYHTNYFLRPETVGQLASWLKLPSPLQGIDALALAGVERDLVELDGSASVATAYALLRQEDGSLIVVTRPDPRPGRRGDLRYAFLRSEVEQRLGNALPTATVADALDLHETDASPSIPLTAVGVPVADRSPRRGGVATTRSVVMAAGVPAGVLQAGTGRMGMTALAALARTLAGAGSVPNPGAHVGFSTPRSMAPATPPGAPKRSGEAKTAPVADRPSPRTEIDVMAEMPRTVVVDGGTTLTVTLSVETLQSTPGLRSELGRTSIDADRRIVVDVVPRSGFDYLPGDATRGREEVDPPTPKQPVILDFDLLANEVGEGEVDITVRQGAQRRLRLTLRCEVVAAQTDRVVPLASSGASIAVHESTGDSASLVVFDRRNDGRLQLEFILEAEGAYDRFHSDPIRIDPAAYAERTYEAIEAAWTGSGRAIDRFEDALAAWGGEMFEGLFPVALQRVLWSLAESERLAGIQIVSTEPFIPWEIVHVSDPDNPGGEGRFLAEFGLCRWLYGATPTRTIDVRSDGARYVVPHYPDQAWRLASAEEVEEPYLRDTLGATRVAPMVREVLDLLKQRPGGIDLLHFACHGEAEVGRIDSSALLMQGEVIGDGAEAAWVKEPLSASMVRKFAALIGPRGERPMVVVNACQTGRTGHSFTGVGGFATAFIGTREGTGDSRGRAGAFVGALWQVGDAPAATFVIALYEHLRAGHAMAEASRLARQDARAKGDATWLAYSVYAHSQLQVRFDGQMQTSVAAKPH